MIRKTTLKTIIRENISQCLIVLCCLSCGKKIETTTDEESVVTRPAASSSELNLTVSTLSNNSGEDEILTQYSGWAKIPPYLTIVASKANIVYSSLIIENLENSFQSSSQFVCQYLSLKNGNQFDHQFIGCKEDIDYDGKLDDLNYRPGDEIAINENQIVKIKVKSSDNNDNLEVKSHIEVNWR